MKASLLWTLIWILSALLFDGGVWLYYSFWGNDALAQQKALEFLTGYLLEKSLSLDNLFVFYLIFQSFLLPVQDERRVLRYGFWGAAILRLLFILGGIWLLTRFHWLFYPLGAFLMVAGARLFFSQHETKHVVPDWLLRGIKRILPATSFWQAVILVECCDLIFALDSIPAIFAITQDVFIIWTSNIFAILGLRSLYFVLAHLADRFHYVKYGIALILVLLGIKMLLGAWVTVSLPLTLGLIVSILACALLGSVLAKKQ